MSAFVDKQPRAINAQINVKTGLFVAAKIEGMPTIKTTDPIFWKMCVFSISV